MLTEHVLVTVGGYATAWLTLQIAIAFAGGSARAVQIRRKWEVRFWNLAYYLCVLLVFLGLLLGTTGLLLCFKEIFIG